MTHDELRSFLAAHSTAKSENAQSHFDAWPKDLSSLTAFGQTVTAARMAQAVTPFNALQPMPMPSMFDFDTEANAREFAQAAAGLFDVDFIG